MLTDPQIIHVFIAFYEDLLTHRLDDDGRSKVRRMLAEARLELAMAKLKTESALYRA